MPRNGNWTFFWCPNNSGTFFSDSPTSCLCCREQEREMLVRSFVQKSVVKPPRKSFFVKFLFSCHPAEFMAREREREREKVVKKKGKVNWSQCRLLSKSRRSARTRICCTSFCLFCQQQCFISFSFCLPGMFSMLRIWLPLMRDCVR